MRQRVAAEGAESGTSHVGFVPSWLSRGLGGGLPLLLGRGMEHAGQRALGLGVSEELGDTGAGVPEHTGFRLSQYCEFEILKATLCHPPTVLKAGACRASWRQASVCSITAPGGGLQQERACDPKPHVAPWGHEESTASREGLPLCYWGLAPSWPAAPARAGCWTELRKCRCVGGMGEHQLE